MQICIGAFSSDALDADVASSTRAKIIEELGTLGASVVSEQGKTEIESDCFETPECLREAVANLFVAGVLEIRVLRIGPMVRVSMRLFNASNGEKVLETASVASAAGFPESASLTQDLGRVLGALRQEALAIKPEDASAEEKEILTEEAPIERDIKKGKEVNGRAGARAAKENAGHERLSGQAAEKLPDLWEKTAVRMNPYKKWGHIAFWTGLGLATLGTVSAAMYSVARGDYSSGDWGAESDIKAWYGMMITGYLSGAALMATGIVLWVSEPSGSAVENEEEKMSVGATCNGRGVVFTVGGRW